MKNSKNCSSPSNYHREVFENDEKKSFDDEPNFLNFNRNTESSGISIPSFHEYCVLKSNSATQYIIKDHPFYEWMSDKLGWGNPIYYETIRTITVKSKLFIFGIRSGMVHSLIFNIKNKHLELLEPFQWLENSNDWNLPSFYQTVNINQIDKKIILSVKNASEFRLLAFDLQIYHFACLPFLRLQDDWTRPEHYKTIKVVVCNDMLYVFGRQGKRIFLAKFDINLSVWEIMPSINWLGDAEGWNNEMYYETIRLAPVHKKIWVIARGCNIIHTASFDTETLKWNIIDLQFQRFTNSKGWNSPIYYKTINTLVVNHKIFLFGRGTYSFHLFCFDTIDNRWTDLPFFEKFTNSTGWRAPEYYETIKGTVLNHKLIFFARGSEHLHGISFNTVKNGWKHLSIQNCNWLCDSKGWNHPKYYKTIQISRIKNKIIIFARGAYSIHLSLFEV